MADILDKARQEEFPSTWKVLQSEIYSFSDLTHTTIDLDIALKRVCFVSSFLFINYLALIIAIANGAGGFGAGVIFLLTLFLDTCAVMYFSILMMKAIKQTPPIQMETPNEKVLPILMPEGFIEYIDEEVPIDYVLYENMSSIYMKMQDDHTCELHLSYFNDQQGQWSQRANFGAPVPIAEQILTAYQNHYKKKDICLRKNSP